MTFSHSSNVNASRGIFTDVGRDLISQTHVDHQTIHIHLMQPGALHHVLQSVSGNPSHTISGLETPSLSATSSLSSSFARDHATDLMIQIVQSLMDRESSDYYRDLKLELELLHKTSTLTGLAIQTYEYTPLGRNLANVVNREAEQCCVVLQELRDKINCYRQGLNSTTIQTFWRQVLWSGCEVEELASLRRNLSTRQKSLGGCLAALHSYV